MWKEAVYSRHFPGGTEENYEKPESEIETIQFRIVITLAYLVNTSRM
jgi:hypothetical protein